MTEYLATRSRPEREEVRHELERMYNLIVDEEAAAWRDAHADPTSANRVAYREAIGKLGTIQAVLEILGIEFEFGRKI